MDKSNLGCFSTTGQRDLVMMTNSKFADDLWLDIHIRTKIVCVVRICNRILEIEGTLDDDDTEYWVSYEYQGDLRDFAGFRVTQTLPTIYKGQCKMI